MLHVVPIYYMFMWHIFLNSFIFLFLDCMTLQTLGTRLHLKMIICQWRRDRLSEQHVDFLWQLLIVVKDSCTNMLLLWNLIFVLLPACNILVTDRQLCIVRSAVCKGYDIILTNYKCMALSSMYPAQHSSVALEQTVAKQPCIYRFDA